MLLSPLLSKSDTKQILTYDVLLGSGEYGMGTMANDLTLGCDCLGQIHYLVSIPERPIPASVKAKTNKSLYCTSYLGSLVRSWLTTAVRSKSRTRFAFTRRMLVCYGSTRIIDLVDALPPFAAEGSS